MGFYCKVYAWTAGENEIGEKEKYNSGIHALPPMRGLEHAPAY
jgi:hypothetical protein